MTVGTNKHPLYTDRKPEWEQMNDTYAGPVAVKAKKTEYLPATSGMYQDGYPQGDGGKAYTAYITRAVFPELVKDAIDRMVGIMHRKPAKITLPKAMEPLLEKATPQGESLQALLRRINTQQLKTGRLGLLIDVPTAPVATGVLPYVALYEALSIINWDTQSEMGSSKINFVVLDESGQKVNPATLGWDKVEQYRVLRAGPSGKYEVAIASGDSMEYAQLEWKEPQIAGKALEQVPFVFINAADLVPAPDAPPLMGLSNLSLTIYRGEADYRQALFMQGQDTLVVIGAQPDLGPDGTAVPLRIGAGGMISLPMSGDAKFIGTESSGLTEMKDALQNDRKAAEGIGAALLDVGAEKGSDASGEALKTRVAANTATLTSIARAGAEALQSALRFGAEWLGLNPEDVIVEPNLEFSRQAFGGAELLSLVSAKNMGAPLSRETIHEQMVKHEMTTKTLEEELEAIEQEEPIGITNELAIQQLENKNNPDNQDPQEEDK